MLQTEIERLRGRAGKSLRGLVASSGSVAFHAAILASLLAASYLHVEPLAEHRASIALIWTDLPSPAAAPALPAPPPGPARIADRLETTREVTPTVVEPREVPRGVLDEVPAAEETSAGDGAEGGIEGGVEGGVPGGVPGGLVGGIPDGVLGGVLGGPPGGVLDGLPGQDHPIHLAGDVRPPQRVAFLKPQYPELARKARVEGKVILEIVVGRSGDVENVRVLKSHPLLDDAAIEAVKRWRYRPGLQGGRPVKVYLTVVVEFTLS